MDDGAVLQASRAVERFSRAMDSVRIGTNREGFLEDLVQSTLQVTQVDRVAAILMEQNTVCRETAAARNGRPYAADEETRKASARMTIKAGKRGRDDDGNPVPAIEAFGTKVFLTAPLDGNFAVTLILDKAPLESGDLVAAANLLAALARLQKARTEDAQRNAAEEAVTAQGGVGAVAFLKPVADLERDAIELALRTTGWNKEEAARKLGISRASIYMKVKKFGLQKPI